MTLKNFIIGFGSKFIDIIVVVSIILVILAALIAMTNIGFFYGVGVLVFGSLSIIMSTFFLYLMIDIREKLVTIAANTAAGKPSITSEKAE
ncbi:hypothetical protein [uncultured Ruminobacter sp.]|uniref:hypothetical protein n=1 Tax=uncultured Ruminobacter sp. TaxID=538947 RepID=UPI0025E353CB|nr:hypothetical protein [uncultured Ruminobacter sp.]